MELMGLPGVPELVLYLPFWRRLRIAWSLVWHGRAVVPEYSSVAMRRKHRKPVLDDLT